MTDDKKPFNDVMDHASKIEGALLKDVNLNRLPLGIRIIGYFIAGFLVISIILGIIFSLIY